MSSRIALALLAAAGLARAEEPAPAGPQPMMGDVANGARLYRVHCAACHGSGRTGNGPLAPEVNKSKRVPDLNEPALMLSFDTPSLAELIGKGEPPAMPGFGQALSILDTFDLMAFLREGMVTVEDFWPATARYTAKNYKLDEYAIEKVEKSMGDKVADAEKNMLLMVGFLGDVGRDGPEIVPQDPRLLDSLPWRRKTGYLSFVPVTLSGKTYTIGMAIDTEGTIALLKTATGSAPDRGKLDALLLPFDGLGGRNAAKKPLEIPKGTKVKVPPELVKTVSRGFWRTIGAIGLHDKEERDRHVFDADYGDPTMEAGGDMEMKKKKKK